MSLWDEIQVRRRNPLSLVGSCRSIRPPDPTPSLKDVYAEDERLWGDMDEALRRETETDLRELGLTAPVVSGERSS